MLVLFLQSLTGPPWHVLTEAKVSSSSRIMYAMVPQQVQQQTQQIHFQQQRIKQQQQLMQQAIMQPHMYHPGLLTTLSQLPAIEPIPSGNLPPGFDASSCRSVYVGNIHSKVTEALLAEIFGATGPLESCKLIKKEKSSYGFIDYYDHRAAASALLQLNGKVLFGQAIKVNWAYASGQREDTTGHYNIFVGDLSPEVTDSSLYEAFRVYPTCSDARVMWDQKSGRSRGFGFVSFRTQQDADIAIKEMNGKWLGSRQIRCNWATKTVTLPGEGAHGKENQASDPLGLATGSAAAGQSEQEGQGERPEDNPSYTTVYVGNLAHEVTQTELHRQFHALSVGAIEDVRVQRDKGFGFVRYQFHEEAAQAIQAANGRVICGKSVKCSWGSKPTPAGIASSPLPPPPPAAVTTFPGVIATANLGQGYNDFIAFQRQMTLGANGSSRGIIPLPQAQTLQGMQIGMAVPGVAGVAVSMPLAGMNVGLGQLSQHGITMATGSGRGFEYQVSQARAVASPGISQQRMYF